MQNPVDFVYNLCKVPGVSLLINQEKRHNRLVAQAINSFVSYIQYKGGLKHLQNNLYFNNRWWNKQNVLQNIDSEQAQQELGFSHATNSFTKHSYNPSVFKKFQSFNRELKQVNDKTSTVEHLSEDVIKRDLGSFTLLYWSNNFHCFEQQYLATNSPYISQLYNKGEVDDLVHRIREQIQAYSLLKAPSWLVESSKYVNDYLMFYLDPFNYYKSISSENIQEFCYCDQTILSNTCQDILNSYSEQEIVLHFTEQELEAYEVLGDYEEIVIRKVFNNLETLYQFYSKNFSSNEFTIVNYTDLNNMGKEILANLKIETIFLPSTILVPLAHVKASVSERCEKFKVGSFTQENINRVTFTTTQLNQVGSNIFIEEICKIYPNVKHVIFYVTPKNDEDILVAADLYFTQLQFESLRVSYKYLFKPISDEEVENLKEKMLNVSGLNEEAKRLDSLETSNAFLRNNVHKLAKIYSTGKYYIHNKRFSITTIPQLSEQQARTLAQQIINHFFVGKKIWQIFSDHFKHKQENIEEEFTELALQRINYITLHNSSILDNNTKTNDKSFKEKDIELLAKINNLAGKIEQQLHVNYSESTLEQNAEEEKRIIIEDDNCNGEIQGIDYQLFEEIFMARIEENKKLSLEKTKEIVSQVKESDNLQLNPSLTSFTNVTSKLKWKEFKSFPDQGVYLSNLSSIYLENRSWSISYIIKEQYKNFNIFESNNQRTSIDNLHQTSLENTIEEIPISSLPLATNLSLDRLWNYLKSLQQTVQVEEVILPRVIYIEDWLTFLAHTLEDNFPYTSLQDIRTRLYDLLAKHHSIKSTTIDNNLITAVNDYYQGELNNLAVGIDQVLQDLRELAHHYNVHIFVNFNLPQVATSLAVPINQVWSKLSQGNYNFLNFSFSYGEDDNDVTLDRIHSVYEQLKNVDDKIDFLTSHNLTINELLYQITTPTYLAKYESQLFLAATQKLGFEYLTYGINTQYHHLVPFLINSQATINLELVSQNNNLHTELKAPSNKIILTYYPYTKHLSCRWDE